MLMGLAEAVAIDATDLNGMIAAVTEACNNVVMHAYGQAEGPLEVEVYAGPDAVEVVVRDRGSGIREQTASRILDESSQQEALAGVGFLMVQALCERADIRTMDDGGTEVWMAFEAGHAPALGPLLETVHDAPALSRSEPGRSIQISIAPASLAQPILPLVLNVLAARAYFGTDRIAHVQRVANALAARAPGALRSDHVSVEISIEPHDLQLRIAPFRAGGASRLMHGSLAEDLAPVSETLAYDYSVASADRGREAEMLDLRLTDRR